MSNTSSAAWAARVRRAWAERYAYKSGMLNLADIRGTFAISYAQASSDVQGLLADHPGCLCYDSQLKAYRWDQSRVPLLQIPAPIRDFL